MNEFPWKDVLSCQDKKKSTVSGETVEEYLEQLGVKIRCPNCKRQLDSLDVFYFEHQAGPLVGVGGWMIACLKCKKQLRFEMEWIS